MHLSPEQAVENINSVATDLVGARRGKLTSDKPILSSLSSECRKIGMQIGTAFCRHMQPQNLNALFSHEMKNVRIVLKKTRKILFYVKYFWWKRHNSSKQFQGTARVWYFACCAIVKMFQLLTNKIKSVRWYKINNFCGGAIAVKTNSEVGKQCIFLIFE